MKSQPTNIRIPEDLESTIDDLAKNWKSQKADVIRWALRFGIEKLLEDGVSDPETVFREHVEQKSQAAVIMRRNILAPHSLPEPTANVIELPFLGAVAAGEPVEAPRDETIPVSREYPPKHFIVEVNGDSMEPDYPDGSRWIIDGKDKFTPKDGAVCVVSDGTGSYLKRWNKKSRVFESINPKRNHVLPAAEATLQGYPVEPYAAP